MESRFYRFLMFSAPLIFHNVFIGIYLNLQIFA